MGMKKSYPLVMSSYGLNGPVEIVSFPNKDDDFPHSDANGYQRLPEGSYISCMMFRHLEKKHIKMVDFCVTTAGEKRSGLMALESSYQWVDQKGKIFTGNQPDFPMMFRDFEIIFPAETNQLIIMLNPIAYHLWNK